jgi:hypothetical protein
MSAENNNICNAVNCVSCVLKDFSDNQVGVITPNALVSCTGLPVSCCVNPLDDLNDWYNLSLPPFSIGTDKLLFHRYDDCFYYPMCYCSSWGHYVLDKTQVIYNGDVYCIDSGASSALRLKYTSSTWYLNPSAYEWWLYRESSSVCDITIYAPSVNANSVFVVSDICAWFSNYYYIQSNGLIPISAFDSCFKHNSIGDKVCLL